MFKWATAVGLAIVALASGRAFALESSGAQTVTEMGCDNADTICHVTISGSAVGSTVGCPSNTIVWDVASDANGKVTYTSLLAAFIAGKQVTIFITSCMSGLPTISYYQISS